MLSTCIDFRVVEALIITLLRIIISFFIVTLSELRVGTPACRHCAKNSIEQHNANAHHRGVTPSDVCLGSLTSK